MDKEKLAQLISELAEDWMNDWNESKDKIARKLSKPYYQRKWKRETLSPSTVKKRRERLIEAINAGLIEAGLAEVDPAEWATEVVKGVENTTVDESDAQKWAKNASPYLAVILSKKDEFDKLNLSGKEAMVWWYDNVSKKLHEMKLKKGKKEIIEVVSE